MQYPFSKKSKIPHAALEKLRELTENYDHYRHQWKNFFAIFEIFSTLHLSEEFFDEILKPCWGHFDVSPSEGCDVIDGPEKSFKLQCDICMKPYIMKSK